MVALAVAWREDQMRCRLSLAAALTLFLCSCAQQPYERLHSALEILADAHVATDKILVEAQGPAITEAREEIPAEYEGLMKVYVGCLAEGQEGCVDPGDPRAFVEGRFAQRIGRWGNVAKGLDLVRVSILEGEVVARAWRSNQAPPVQWRSVCVAIGEGTQLVMEGLETMQVEVPPQWAEASQYVGPLCLLVGGRIEDAVGNKLGKEVEL
jgi:hypothetical protein